MTGVWHGVEKHEGVVVLEEEEGQNIIILVQIEF